MRCVGERYVYKRAEWVASLPDNAARREAMRGMREPERVRAVAMEILGGAA